jgi:hypothetical protein
MIVSGQKPCTARVVDLPVVLVAAGEAVAHLALSSQDCLQRRPSGRLPAPAPCPNRLVENRLFLNRLFLCEEVCLVVLLTPQVTKWVWARLSRRVPWPSATGRSGRCWWCVHRHSGQLAEWSAGSPVAMSGPPPTPPQTRVLLFKLIMQHWCISVYRPAAWSTGIAAIYAVGWLL